MTRVGLVSDTHGLLRPETMAFLDGCDHIVHAGDICDLAVLTALRALAPLTVVRGNNDVGRWADDLPHVATLQIGGVSILVVHDLDDLKDRGEAARIGSFAGTGNHSGKDVRVVVSGHSHNPSVERQGDDLFVNPGSAGPRRFKLPISIGELLIDGSEVEARLVNLCP